MIHKSVESGHVPDDSDASRRIAAQSTSPAPRSNVLTAERPSLGRRLLGALTGGSNRKPTPLHPPLGRTPSSSSAIHRPTFLVLALLGALAFGLLFLMPDAFAQTQTSSRFTYPENSKDPRNHTDGV